VRTLAVLVAAAITVPGPCLAQTATLDAQTAAILHDLLSPYGDGSNPPANADPAAFRKAFDILKREGLLAAERPRLPSSDVLANLGTAIGLGSQATKAVGEISQLSDALTRNDDIGAEKAIEGAYARLGWKAPTGELLAKLRKAANEAVAAHRRPAQVLERKGDGYSVRVVNDSTIGKANVDIELKGDAKTPQHVTFEGNLKTQPAPSGNALRTAAEGAQAKTYSSDDVDKVRESQNGHWTDQNGEVWEVSGTGSSIVLLHKRAAGERKYEGNIHFKDAEAIFKITRVEDLSDGLPLRVRQQLLGKGLDFKVRLKFDDAERRFDGVWISSNVTYDLANQTVERIHDPFESALVLRAQQKRMAQGGRYPQEGP
jgi:hypothetical protein